jgi:hypothetical protein
MKRELKAQSYPSSKMMSCGSPEPSAIAVPSELPSSMHQDLVVDVLSLEYLDDALDRSEDRVHLVSGRDEHRELHAGAPVQ